MVERVKSSYLPELLSCLKHGGAGLALEWEAPSELGTNARGQRGQFGIVAHGAMVDLDSEGTTVFSISTNEMLLFYHQTLLAPHLAPSLQKLSPLFPVSPERDSKRRSQVLRTRGLLRCRRLLTTYDRRGFSTSRLHLQQAVRATPPTIMPFSRNASDETGKAPSSPRPPNVQIGRLFLLSCNVPNNPWSHPLH